MSRNTSKVALPDLVVIWGRLPQGAAFAGIEASVDVRIKNNGSATAYNVKTALLPVPPECDWRASNPQGTIIGITLLPGESRDIPDAFAINCSTKGVKNLTVVVDYENLVHESNETNNNLTFRFTVLGTYLRTHPLAACSFDYNGDTGVYISDISALVASGKFNQSYSGMDDQSCQLEGKPAYCFWFDGNRDGRLDELDSDILGIAYGKICNLSILDYNGDGTIESNTTFDNDGYRWIQYAYQPPNPFNNKCSSLSGEEYETCLTYDVHANLMIEFPDLFLMQKYDGMPSGILPHKFNITSAYYDAALDTTYANTTHAAHCYIGYEPWDKNISMVCQELTCLSHVKTMFQPRDLYVTCDAKDFSASDTRFVSVPMPDLVITNAWFNASGVYEEEFSNLSATVRNQGPAPASNVYISASSIPPNCTVTNMSLNGTKYPISLRPGESRTLSPLFRVACYTDGFKRFTLKADPSNLVEERSEVNNEKNATLTVFTLNCLDFDGNYSIPQQLGIASRCIDSFTINHDTSTSNTTVREYLCSHQRCISNVYNCLAYGYTNSYGGKCENDTSAPNVTIISPISKTYNRSRLLIFILASDDAISIWWNNGTANLTYNGTTYRTFGEGNHTIHAYARDWVGNIGEANVTFGVDTTGPAITIYSPTNSTPYRNSTVALNVSANEPTSSWLYSLNGAANNSFTPNTTITGVEGPNSVVVYARDLVGKWGSASRTFYIDTLAPNITIISPENRSYNISTILVNISAPSAQTIWYNWNGSNWAYSAPVLVTFSQGNITLAAYANDSAGNLASASVNFTVDSIPPYLQFEPPFSNVTIMTYNTTTLQLNITSTGVYTWYNWNGTDTTYSGPVNITFPSNGSTTLRAYANDSLGNTNTTSTSFTFDITPPNIQIISPLNQTYNNATLLLNITSNGVRTWYNWNGTDANYTAPLFINFPQGNTTLYAYANDSMGNTNSTSVLFTVDSMPPLVNLSWPANNSTIIYGLTPFKYSVIDEGLGIANCSLYMNTTGNATNLTFIAANQTPVQAGPFTNNITYNTSLLPGYRLWNVRCFDKAGNSAFNESNRTVRIRAPLACGENLTESFAMDRDLTCNGYYNAVGLAANGIELDCNGFTIYAGGSNYGIIGSGFNNLTIKNCIVRNPSTSGIYLDSSRGSLLLKDEVYNASDGAIRLMYVNNSKIYNVTAFSDRDLSQCIAMKVSYSNFDEIVNSTGIAAAFSDDGIGLHASASQSFTIYNSTFVSRNGIYMAGSDYFNITNSTIMINGGNGAAFQLDAGPDSSGSDYNRVVNSTIDTWAGPAIFLASTSGYNYFENITASGEQAVTTTWDYPKSYNRFYKSFLLGWDIGAAAVLLYNVQNTTIENSTIVSNNTVIYFDGPSLHYLINSTLIDVSRFVPNSDIVVDGGNLLVTNTTFNRSALFVVGGGGAGIFNSSSWNYYRNYTLTVKNTATTQETILINFTKEEINISCFIPGYDRWVYVDPNHPSSLTELNFHYFYYNETNSLASSFWGVAINMTRLDTPVINGTKLMHFYCNNTKVSNNSNGNLTYFFYDSFPAGSSFPTARWTKTSGNIAVGSTGGLIITLGSGVVQFNTTVSNFGENTTLISQYKPVSGTTDTLYYGFGRLIVANPTPPVQYYIITIYSNPKNVRYYDSINIGTAFTTSGALTNYNIAYIIKRNASSTVWGHDYNFTGNISSGHSTSLEGIGYFLQGTGGGGYLDFVAVANTTADVTWTVSAQGNKGGDGSATVKWYVRVNATYATNGTPASYANVSAFNKFNTNVYNATANVNGLTELMPITDLYTSPGIWTEYSPYNFTVSKSGFMGWASNVTVNQSRELDITLN